MAFSVDSFDVTCLGGSSLRGLCVRDRKCLKGNTAKSNSLVSFSINFMALSSFLLQLPETEGENVF